MIVATHQPDYLPYLGFFLKVACSDVLVFLDDVQYSKRGMHDFNYIKTPQGKYKLKVPVSCSYTSKINEVELAQPEWYEKHLKTLEMSYKRAPYFNEVQSILKELLPFGYKNLSDLNISVNKAFIERAFPGKKFIVSSELGISSTKEARIIDICKAVDADTYMSGTGAMAYQNEEDFAKEGIELKYATFSPFEYKQQWGEFVPYLSAIDYFMNCGFDSLGREFEQWKM